MTDYEKILEKMRLLDDEAIKEILMIHFADYTDFALEAARAVLDERGINESIQEQSDTVNSDVINLETFKDCIKAVDYQVVEKKMAGLFKESDKNLELFRIIYKDLMMMKPVNEEPIQLFLAQVKEDLSQGYPFDVFGMQDGEEGYFGLEMFTWSEWLGLKIFDNSKSLILNLGLDEFVALCLKKMTTFGFTEGEIEEKISAMQGFEEFDVQEEIEES